MRLQVQKVKGQGHGSKVSACMRDFRHQTALYWDSLSACCWPDSY